MATLPPPELSIVIATDACATISQTLRCLFDQSDSARLEIVIATLAGAALDRDAPELRGFPLVRIVEGDDGIDIGRAEARAVESTTAPFVIFAESCAYPGPGFVDAMAAACRTGKGDVIGPALRNANPDSATSWAGMQINYGRSMDNPAPGVRLDVPGHNSAYRRAALASLGEEFRDVMASLTAVQQELRARGGVIYLEPSASVEMLNISRPGWYLVDQFGKGRQYARLRRRRWVPARRAVYAAGAPLIPLLRLLRILTGLAREDRLGELWRGHRFALLVAGLVTGAAGEFVGYTTGGPAGTGFFERNLHRPRFVRDNDRLRHGGP